MQEEIEKLKQEIEKLKESQSALLPCRACNGRGIMRLTNILSGICFDDYKQTETKCECCKGCGYVGV